MIVQDDVQRTVLVAVEANGVYDRDRIADICRGHIDQRDIRAAVGYLLAGGLIDFPDVPSLRDGIPMHLTVPGRARLLASEDPSLPVADLENDDQHHDSPGSYDAEHQHDWAGPLVAGDLVHGRAG